MAPEAWIVSRICEEFGCTPSQALYELDETPWPLVFDVMELRAFARAKQTVDDAKKAEDIPKTPMIDWVMDVKKEIIKQRREAMGGR